MSCENVSTFCDSEKSIAIKTVNDYLKVQNDDLEQGGKFHHRYVEINPTASFATLPCLHFIIIASQNLSHLKIFPAKTIFHIWIYFHLRVFLLGDDEDDEQKLFKEIPPDAIIIIAFLDGVSCAHIKHSKSQKQTKY